MYQPWITVEVEDDRLIGGEQRIEIRICQPVGMFRTRLQFEQIDHVDETDLQVGELLAQQYRCCQSFLRGNIARGSYNHVGLTALIVTSPFPDADAFRAVLDCSVHVQDIAGGVACRKQSR